MMTSVMVQKFGGDNDDGDVAGDDDDDKDKERDCVNVIPNLAPRRDRACRPRRPIPDAPLEGDGGEWPRPSPFPSFSSPPSKGKEAGGTGRRPQLHGRGRTGQ